MADVHSRAVRSRNMAAIRATHTRPEVLVRRFLHAEGYRFRLHDRGLPGRPDIVMRRHRAVIMVNGCFFHGHHCRYFRLPATRAQFWQTKIASNRARDQRNMSELLRQGWRVLTVWECALRGNAAARADALARVLGWLQSDCRRGNIRCRQAASKKRSGA